jgi:hypothetical protein
MLVLCTLVKYVTHINCALFHQDQLLAALVATCLVAFLAEIMAEETTTEVSSNSSRVSGNATQNA